MKMRIAMMPRPPATSPPRFFRPTNNSNAPDAAVSAMRCDGVKYLESLSTSQMNARPMTVITAEFPARCENTDT